MNKEIIGASELVLHKDGSVYHLRLLPEHIAPNVILVGDPGRVSVVSGFFDHIDAVIENREFVTHVGTYKGQPITVISTGIGTDNIDIVVNEIDAAVNIDLKTRLPKTEKTRLNLIRLGTSGALQLDIPVETQVISAFSLGFDGLMHYYDYAFSEEEQALAKSINTHLNWNPKLAEPYIIKASTELTNKLGEGMRAGITATAPGFYAPQGRQLNLAVRDRNVLEKLASYQDGPLAITNFEMECSALYGLGKALGHNCCTCCVILANRRRKEFANDYKAAVSNLIQTVLDRLVA